MYVTNRIYEEVRRHSADFALDVIEGKHREWTGAEAPADFAVGFVAAHLADGWADMLFKCCPEGYPARDLSAESKETILAITRRTIEETLAGFRPEIPETSRAQGPTP